jgi:hypothetical protein
MLTKIKEFFLGKSKTPVAEAPYKVEAPATDWPFPRPTEPATEPAPAVASAPAKKPRAPAKPKAAPAVKPAVAAKQPRAKKTPAK